MSRYGQKRAIIDYIGSIRRPPATSFSTCLLTPMQKRFDFRRSNPDVRRILGEMCRSGKKRSPNPFRLATDSKHRSILRASSDSDSSATKSAFLVKRSVSTTHRTNSTIIIVINCHYPRLVRARKIGSSAEAEDPESREFLLSVICKRTYLLFGSFSLRFT